MGGFTFLGCYRDDENRDLDKYIGSDNTHTTCNAACDDGGYRYFALQYGTQCFCGNDYSTPSDAYPRLADDECHTSAMPVLTDWSGSDWANAIYEVKKANPSKCTVRFFYDGEMSAEYLFQEFELDINKGYTVGKSEGDLPKSLKYEQLNLNWDSGNLQAMENAPTGVQCTGCPDDTILVLF